MSKSYLRKNRIAGQFAPRTIDMLESPAFQVLSLAGHRVLARIEIELAHHGGNDNGRLPVTFDHFAEYGMDRHAIAPALREVCALGFIEITEQGAPETPNGDGLTSSGSPTGTQVAPIKPMNGAGLQPWRRPQ